MTNSFSEKHQPHKRRGKSRGITKAEVDAARDRLRDAASAGDIQACAVLIALAERQPILAGRAIAA